MRVAVFFAPPPDHPLSLAAAAWLGRDAFTGAAVPRTPVAQLDPAETDALTAEPRRYGFHATLKPPFHLASGQTLATVSATAEAFAVGRRPVTIPALRIEPIGSFFALTPGAPVAALDDLAAEAVRVFDPFRAPPDVEEVARRRPDLLSPRQREHLRRWGYPYVFEDFRFHMTLTGRVPPERQAAVGAALADCFAGFIGRPLAVDSIALFVEPHPPSDFVVSTHIPFTPAAMDAA